MKYIAPAMKIEEAQAAQMLAESLPINSDVTVNGSQTLTKENYAWDIWEDIECTLWCKTRKTHLF